ncbi:TonB-dependent receptor plug domain-containing protein [Vibrio sp. Y2-5]|nr:TonB-dependent receptor plug domain-containing protein [Vibrio sp. Y2-5]MBD0786530.1 TonB-dependent receptor plug domain-containing protein [Vibrio sp. Y2-5]
MKKATCIYTTLVFISATAYADDKVLEHLMSLSLEELSMLNVRMETATKSSRRLADIPSSVYVLSNERIIRSGVRTIPDALALVPGLHVSKYSDTEWIVSARGFHDGLFNKQLVMIDGRSVYSPLYGGVYWADIDYVLDDIDRIEVLRGPGAALWGGNAVNGVINIITKSAKETQGSFVSAGWAEGGDYDASVRHGLQLSEDVSARAFYKKRQLRNDRNKPYPDWTLETAGIVTQSDLEQNDWEFRMGGERLTYSHDWYQLHYSNGDLSTSERVEQDVDSYSFYTQLRYETRHSDKLTGNYQLWFERNSNEMADDAGLSNTLDLDFNYNHQITDEHLITYGGGYRLVEVEFFHPYEGIDFNNLPYYQRYATDQQDVDSIVNLHLQSEKVWNSKWKTVAGVKLEYFELSDQFEVSPQLRTLLTIDENQTAWVGYGRASVAPSYLTSNTYLVTNYYDSEQDRYFAELMVPEGNMKPESVSTYEVGYRYDSEIGFEFDASFFLSHHSYVRGLDNIEVSGVPDQVVGVVITDDYSLETHGVELSAGYIALETLRFYLSYSYLHAKGEWNGGSNSNGSSVNWYDIEAQHNASLQTLWDISPQWKLDFIVRGQSIQYHEQFPQIPNYLAFDARLAWQAHSKAPRLEFILQNIGEKDGYRTDWISTINEETGVLKASYEF